MAWILLGILSSLIQIGVMVGVVVLIVRFVSGRDKATSVSVGVLIRRFFVYSIMLTMLILVGIGIAGLIEAALPTTGEITSNSADAARSIAFILVGLPVYLALQGHNYLPGVLVPGKKDEGLCGEEIGDATGVHIDDLQTAPVYLYIG